MILMTSTSLKLPPFRADHVGSFLRPAELMAARQDFADGKILKADLRAVEDRLIKSIVETQENAGLQSITDGDFRRLSWSGDFLTAIDGVEMRQGLVSPSASSAPETTPLGGVVRNWQPPTPATVSSWKSAI